MPVGWARFSTGVAEARPATASAMRVAEGFMLLTETMSKLSLIDRTGNSAHRHTVGRCFYSVALPVGFLAHHIRRVNRVSSMLTLEVFSEINSAARSRSGNC